MSVLKITGRVECADCGNAFSVEIDPAAPCATAFEAVEEAMRGGEGSYYDGVMRCDDCTGRYTSKWIAANPNKISGISQHPDGWRVTTYADVTHVIWKSAAPREPQFDEEIGPLLIWCAAPELLEAAREAYDFISAPQIMSTPADGPKTATYRIENYNALTAKLRSAIAKAVQP